MHLEIKYIIQPLPKIAWADFMGHARACMQLSVGHFRVR